jgi:hypothetical protein
MPSLNGDRYADIGHTPTVEAQREQTYQERLADLEAMAAANRRLRDALQWIRKYPGIPLAVLAKANEALIGGGK